MKSDIGCNMKRISLLIWVVLACAAFSSWGNSSIRIGQNTHYHENEYNHHGHGYHGRGGYFYGRGPNIIVPNIIIDVPQPRYYPRRCQEVEVCNSFDECWVERHCY